MSQLDRIIPPWTPEQVGALNKWQTSGIVHPFTCGADHDEHSTLVATEQGWICPEDGCFYTQKWAHEMMLHIDDFELPWQQFLHGADMESDHVDG